MGGAADADLGTMLTNFFNANFPSGIGSITQNLGTNRHPQIRKIGLIAPLRGISTTSASRIAFSPSRVR